MRSISFVLFTLLSFHCAGSKEPAPPANPDRKLTRAECTQGVDHAIALFDAEPEMVGAAKSMRDGRAGFITQCETVATLRDHECLMAAKTSHELGLCPMPGTR